jgi:hypothetical protein
MPCQEVCHWTNGVDCSTWPRPYSCLHPLCLTAWQSKYWYQANSKPWGTVTCCRMIATQVKTHRAGVGISTSSVASRIRIGYFAVSFACHAIVGGLSFWDSHHGFSLLRQRVAACDDAAASRCSICRVSSRVRHRSGGHAPWTVSQQPALSQPGWGKKRPDLRGGLGKITQLYGRPVSLGKITDRSPQWCHVLERRS